MTDGQEHLRPALGIAFRPAFASSLFAKRLPIDLVEISYEYNSGFGRAGHTALALTDLYPVTVHSASVSPGSGSYPRRAAVFADAGEFVRQLKPRWWSEHAAVSGEGDEDGFALLPVPRTEEAALCIASNLMALEHCSGVRVLVEYSAAPFDAGGDYDDAAFMNRIVELSGCGTLFDVHNLYANYLNRGVDIERTLGAVSSSIVEVHVAGGRWDGDTYLDSHDRPIPEEVYDILTLVLAEVSPRAVVLERDGAFPTELELLEELERLAAMLVNCNGGPPPFADKPSEDSPNWSERTVHSHRVSELLATERYRWLSISGRKAFLNGLASAMPFSRQLLGSLGADLEAVLVATAAVASRAEAIQEVAKYLDSRVHPSERWRLALDAALSRIAFGTETTIVVSDSETGRKFVVERAEQGFASVRRWQGEET